MSGIANRVLVALGVIGLLAAPLSAQTTLSQWDPGGLQMTRQDLNDLLEQLERVSSSPAYSGSIKERARRDAEHIRERLTRGDFRVGDRVVLFVEGEAEMTDTLAVEPGPRISLPVIGSISLQGVLRSELEEHLTEEIGTYLRDPVVRAESQIRLSIQGTVGSPGYYTVPSDMLVGEALMRAGGPGQNSDLEKLRIERGQRTLWEGEELQEMVADGRTLDQMNLRAGDQLVLPAEEDGNLWWRIGRVAAVAASSIFLGVRLFF